MVVLIREFQSPDEEMKKIVLKVVKQCVGTDGVEPQCVIAPLSLPQRPLTLSLCAILAVLSPFYLLCGYSLY